MNIELFFFKEYDNSTYNCCHFVQDVWEHLTGIDISLNMTGFTKDKKNRNVTLSHMKIYKECKFPKNPSIVYMQHRSLPPHVGIYINGKILHITEKNNVQYTPLSVAAMGFSKIRYFVCKT